MLPSATRGGKNYVQVEVKGTTYTVACLEKDKVEHNSVDLFFGPDDATFCNKGASEVHLLGYLEPKEGEEDSAIAEKEEAPKEASPKVLPKAEAKPKANPKAEAKPKANPK